MKANAFARPDEVAGFDYVELTVRTVGDDERLMPGTSRSSTSRVGGCEQVRKMIVNFGDAWPL
jgi:hypothetical protein